MHPDPVALIALSPQVIAVLDVDGVPRYLTPSAATLFDTVHPDDTELLETAFADAVLHPRRAVPVRFRAHAGGRVLHLAGQFLNRVDDPRVEGIVLHLADITADATLADISRELIDRGHDDLDSCIVDALGAIAQLSGADRASVALVHANGFTASIDHEWCRDQRHCRDLGDIPLDAVPRLVEVLLGLRTTVLDIADHPELTPDAAAIGATDTRSCALAPVAVDGVLIGCVALEMIGHEAAWPPAVLTLLDQFAPMIASAVERRRVERESYDAQVRFEEAWKHAPIGMVMFSNAGRVLRVNPAYCDLLGYADADLIGAPLRELVHPDDLEEFDDVVARLEAAIADRMQLEMRFAHRLPGEHASEWTWCRVSLSIVRDHHLDGTYLIGQVEDITQRRAFEARLAYEASHDALTGLSQRNPLLGSLERALASAARRGDSVAVLFIDVDNFKRVNDTLGHAAGDELLQSFANRLSRAVRASDMAARLGGDEFVVMCTDLADPRQVVAVAQRILKLVERPFQVRGVEVFVGASIGIAVAEPGVDAATLLQQADTAAYRAKDRGRNRYEIFDDDLRAAVAQRAEIERTLHATIDAGGVALCYQPVVDVAKGTVVLFDVLPQLGGGVAGSLPSEIAAVAEESGLVVPIGKRVTQDACNQLAQWRRDSRITVPGVAVRISQRQFAHPSLVEDTRAAIERAGVAPGSLTLQITESVLMHDPQASMARLQALRQLGVRIAIADFGSGFSSLSHLRRLPVDAIKLDASFVTELGVDHDGSPVVVGAVINLAHALGMDLMADGVSTIEHVAALVTLGCHRMQGDYFSSPVDAAAASELLRRPERQRFGVSPSRSIT